MMCGYDHTIMAAMDGSCWSWGGNGAGQLGLGFAGGGRVESPQRIPGLEGVCKSMNETTNTQRERRTSTKRKRKQIVQLPSCDGWSDHSMAMTKERECFVWGANFWGQLGLGDTNDRTSPTLLEGLE